MDTMLWGFHAVFEAIRARRRQLFEIYLAADKPSERREQIAAMASTAMIKTVDITAQQMSSKLGHRRHQGVCARVSDFPFCAFEALAQGAEDPCHLLVLDQILDPHNFGAMVRTAQCAGVHGIIITKDRSAPPSAAVSKISAGALEHAAVAQVTNLISAIKHLKSQGVWIAGADRDGAVDVFKADLTGPLAIVIGGEEKGLRPLVKKHCDYLMAIPQRGPIGSLNASVAAAVILYEVFRQRRAARPTHGRL